MRKKYRNWFRFSMRSTLIATTLLCLLLGYRVKQMHDRRAALAAIDAIGGASKIRIEGPEWLRNLIGDEKQFYNVGSVTLGPDRPGYDSSRNFDNELRDIIPHLNRFSHFYKLNIASSPVTDEGLLHLKYLTHLDDLNICDREVPDSGLEILMQLKSLKRLNLRDTKVTPDGVAKFQQALPDCEVLWDGK